MCKSVFCGMIVTSNVPDAAMQSGEGSSQEPPPDHAHFVPEVINDEEASEPDEVSG